MGHLTVLSLLHIEGQDQTATLLFDKKNSLFISVYIYRTYMMLTSYTRVVNHDMFSVIYRLSELQYNLNIDL